MGWVWRVQVPFEEVLGSLGYNISSLYFGPVLLSTRPAGRPKEINQSAGRPEQAVHGVAFARRVAQEADEKTREPRPVETGDF